MTLPPFMMHYAANRAQSNLHDLEANGVNALANKFTPPRRHRRVFSDDYFLNLDTAQLPNKSPIVPDNSGDVTDSATLDETLYIVTPPTTPEPTPVVVHAPSPSKTIPAARPSCTLPTANDPIDRTFNMRLHSPQDKGKINPVHVIIRRDVLQVRRTRSRKIFFQCACCAHLPRSKRASVSTLAPQSISNLYRAMVRFMMRHVKECKYVPQEIRALNPKALRNVKVNGTKDYWMKSALEMGLKDGVDGKSIVYCAPTKN